MSKVVDLIETTDLRITLLDFCQSLGKSTTFGRGIIGHSKNDVAIPGNRVTSKVYRTGTESDLFANGIMPSWNREYQNEFFIGEGDLSALDGSVHYNIIDVRLTHGKIIG